MQLIATSWSPENTKLLGGLVVSLKRKEHHYASARVILLTYLATYFLTYFLTYLLVYYATQ